jgi:beta-N-acetylhexosaminidase
MQPTGATRRRRRWAVVVALAGILAACGTTPVKPIAASPTFTATLAPSPTTLTQSSPPLPTPTTCTPLAAIEAWSVARRAGQLVVAPALGGQAAALGAALGQAVGGVLLLGSASADLRQQVTRANALAALPLVIMADQEGGGVQRLGTLVDSLPWPRTMAQTMTAAAVQAAAARVGAQMKALGVTMDLAPVLDLDAGAGPNDTDAIGMRSFSADATVATSYGLAFAAGLQQAGVTPVVKHFPGLGGASGNTEFGTATTPTLSLLQGSGGGLAPFKAAVSAGLPAVMVSHATVPGLTSGPASVSSAAIDGLLRQQLGFHGLVLTDSLSAGAISAAGYTVPTASVAAIAAGADMVLFGSTLTAAQTQLLSPANVAASVTAIVTALNAAVQSGRLPVTRLDDAVLHVIAAKGVDPCAAR